VKPFEEREMHIAIQIALYRHETGEKLKKMERWLAATLHSIGDGVVATNAEGRIIFANPVMEVLTGWTAQEANAAPLESVVQLEDAMTSEPVRDIVVRVAAEGICVGLSPNGTVLRARSGAAISVDTSAAPIRGAGGEVLGSVLVLRDVTERRQLEQTLRLMALAVEQIHDGVVITAAELEPSGPVVVFVNDAFCRMIGYERPEVIGGTLQRLVGAKTELSALAELKSKVSRGEGASGRTLAYRKGGAEFNMEWTVTPLRDVNGTVTHLVGTVRDVTERLGLETQLRQLQKMDTIGQLTAGIAHDFNNIMTVIQGHTSLLEQETWFDREICESISEISAAVGRAATLTRQLLMFSRRQMMRPEPLDATELLNEMARMLRRLLGEMVTLELHTDPSLPRLVADKGMIEQAVVNICVNARDAMPGGGRVSIVTRGVEITAEQARQHAEASPGRFLVLEISDEGVGMDEQTMARIFEPFFTTKDVGKGTGLGLSTAYGIVKQHQGWIEVRSAPQQGSTFTLFLPFENSVAVHAALASPSVKAVAPNGGTETILIVEDEAALRRILKIALEKAGYRVLEASNGRQAIASWESAPGKIDLLLTDMVMPEGVSGRDLATRLRTLQPGLPVIYTSGYSPELSDPAVVVEKQSFFLAKPYKPAEMLTLVRRCLDGAGAA
jgi:PAS domain S-box-containing protein